MATSLKLRIKNINKLVKRFDPKTVKKAVKEGMTKGMLRIEAHAKDPILSGEILKVQTGTLKSRTHSEVQERGSRVIGILKNNTVYAPIHEFGGMAGRNRKVRIPARKPFRTAILAKRKDVVRDIETSIKRRLG